MECIIDPTDDTYMYGALYYGDIRRSSNGGTSFSGIAGSITENGGWVTPYTLDPNNTSTMLAGFDNIWRNTAVKTGSTWTSISSFGGTSNIRDIAVAPSNSDIVYASRYDNTLRLSTNATSGSPTWSTVALPSSNEPLDIEIDPTDPDHIFIALSNNIYESNNATSGSATWTDISGTLPNISLNTIVIDKTSTVGAMYVGMDAGVYYKDNNLADWILYNTNLPNIEITELEIQYGTFACDNMLFGATYGQGLWKSDLKDPGNVAPIACFDANTTSGCVGDSITFTDNSAFTPTSWTWTITPGTFTYTGGTNANSQNPQVIFNAADTYDVQLLSTNGTGNDTLSKIAYITIVGSSVATNFNDDFEAEALCGVTTDCGTTTCNLSGLWTNLTNGVGDNIDWRIDEGGTVSNPTGPSVDYNPGTAAGNYAYTEASGCYAQTAILESSCIDLDQDYNFEFGYHMYGATIGSLHVDIFSSGAWTTDIVTPISGDQGDVWNLMSIDLSAYTTQTVKLRIRGITGTSFTSDLAIDDIVFSAVLSVDDHLLADGISIYPNPAQNTLNIANPQQLDLKEISIYDISGRLINRIDLSTMGIEMSIDIQNLQSAIYILNIKSETGQITKRLIKE